MTRTSRVAGDHAPMVTGDHVPMVAGDHGLWSLFSVAVWSPFLIRFSSTKFPIFGKVEDFVADFPPRVETRSNDVGMT